MTLFAMTHVRTNPLRRSTTRVVAGVVASVVVAGSLAVPTAAQAVAAAPRPVASSETDPSTGQLSMVERLAVRAARETGAPAVISDRTTATTEVFANPDGSRTMNEHTVAQRVARADGTWQDVDTTLRLLPSGRVAPVAAAIDVSFSGGGDTAMAQVGAGEAAVAVSWPSVLPVPVLDGDTATYRQVLPGVDLEVTVTPESYSQVLVVADAQAAANPALSSLRLPIRAGAGDVVAGSGDGGFTVRDSGSGDSLISPAPVMWDSAGATGALMAVPGQDPVVAATGSDPADHAPGEGDEVAPIASAVTSTAVTLTPDAALLRGAGTTYPVFIDPTVALAQRVRQMVNKTYPTSTTGTNWSGDEGVGYNSFDGINTKRLFWDFNTGAILGKQILSATFSAFQTFAATCTVSRVDFYGTGSFNGAFSWNTQPALRRVVASATVANGHTGCNPGGARVEFNAVSLAQEIVTNGWGHAGMGLVSGNEASNDYWKRFRGDATFSVTYNNPPSTPTGLHLASPNKPCATGASRPVIGVRNPILTAVANDADKDNLIGYFEWFTPGGTKLGQAETNLAAGSSYSIRVTFPNDGIFTYSALSSDRRKLSSSTARCEVMIDTTDPAVPTITQNTAATAGGDAPEVGRPIVLTATPGGSKDVVKYGLSLNSDVPQQYTTVPAGQASTSLTITSKTFGPNVVRLWSYDAADNPGSAVGTTTVDVVGAPAKGDWQFDEATGTTVADTVATSPLTAYSGSSRTAGRTREADTVAVAGADNALQLNGVDGYARTATGPDVSSKDNFSFGLWVKPDDLSTSRVAMSLDGTIVPRAWLWWDAGSQRYAFTKPASDSASAALTTVYSEYPAVVGEWVFLAGTFDVETRVITLWAGRGQTINEDRNSSAAISTPLWDAPTGALFIGVNRTATSQPVSRWSGATDQASLYRGLLDPIKIAQLAAVTDQ